MLKKLLLLFLIFCFSNIYSYELSQIESLPKETRELLQQYQSVDIKGIENLIAQFTDEQLESIWNLYTSNKTIPEKRILRLAETYYQRKSDDIASNRTLYLWLALTILFSVIFTFIFLIYYKQTKLYKKIQFVKTRDSN